jgi:uncharacterized C2H2 Zn-finger protein
MTFQCTNCEKIFNRNIDLDRHNDRKIPCDRILQCPRCFMNFTIAGNLKQHVNKKNQCYDKKGELDLLLKIEQEKTKQKELELKVINKTQIAGRDINNNHNTYNINEGAFSINFTLSEAHDAVVIDDIQSTMTKLVSLIFNNPEFPENKCIKVNGKDIFINVDGKLTPFDEARIHFNEKFLKQVNHTTNEFRKFDDEIIDQNGWNQKKDYLCDNRINTLDKIPPYVKKDRNTGKIKKTIKTSLL